MPGVTKHIYNRDIQDILNMWDIQLKSIHRILPKNYSKNEIIKILKTYYPHEWFSVEMKYQYYTKKDEHLAKKLGRSRYNMESPKILLEKSRQYKIIMSSSFKEKYSESFSENLYIDAKCALWKKREPKIQKVNKKIEQAKLKVQLVTPLYIDQLIGLYERKNTCQKDKVYILTELKKYHSPKIIQFFYKLNDTELNKQLRWEAFYYLQSFNYHPRARRQKYMQIHTKNKKRKNYLKNIYPNEKFFISQTPGELEYRINNSREQKIKKYDYFISHSYKDGTLVQKLIEYENFHGNNVFCDWINDSDYLKRNLLCAATLNVIKKRLEQSDALIFVQSSQSIASIWCKYELNYFYEIGKPIYTITTDDINNGVFDKQLNTDNWFIDAKYEELPLLEFTVE